MPLASPSDVAAKWASRLAGATQAIQAGVQAVTVSPTQKAAAQSQAYLAGIQNAVASGKWQRGLQRVDLPTWQNAMISKGLPRVASGATQARPKMEAFMQQWLPYMSGLQAKLASMPRGDFNANMQRAIAAMEYNHAFRRS